MSMKTSKVILIVIALLILLGGVGVAAFYVGDNFGKNQKTVSVVTNPSQPSNTSTDTANPTACLANQLSVTTVSNNKDAAGTLSFDLVFMNTSNKTCMMAGYPGVSLVNSNGIGVGAPADPTTGMQADVITLMNGQSAKASVYYGDKGNYSAGTCSENASEVRVYVPGETQYIDVAAPNDIARCPKFQIGPVQSH